MNTSPCQAIIEARRIKACLPDLTRSTRRLRKALQQCRRCPAQDCPLIRELTSEITTALMELSEEWNL